MTEATNNASEREAFEVWADEKGFCLDCRFFEDGNNYEDADTRLAFDIWQAARIAPVEQSAMVPSVEQLAEALDALACFYGLSAERIAARLRENLIALLDAAPTPEPVSRDWPDGNYYCKCSVCGQQFSGHKRQLVCRLCSEQPAKEVRA